LVSWNFLSASCMFRLTMSSNIAMKFSVITCRISSFLVFLWVSLGPWYSLSLFYWSLELGICFFSFPSESCVKLFWGGDWFPFIFHLPITPLGTV
jgi:hypothetical protein